MSDICQKHNIEMDSRPNLLGRSVYCFICMEEKIQSLEAQLEDAERTIVIERTSAQKHYSAINKERIELQDKNAELRGTVERYREMLNKLGE